MANSRPYRLGVRVTLDKVIVAKDSVQTKIDLPPILPSSERTEILTKVLREKEFKGENGSGILTRERGGVNIDIDPTDGNVTVSTEGDEDIHLEDEGNLPACPPCAERAKESLREGLQEKLNKEADQKERDLQRKVTDRLEGALAEIACELEKTANQVTGTMLKRRAAQMGVIKSIEHNNETGEVKIVVAV